jgi:hypothetical protein
MSRYNGHTLMYMNNINAAQYCLDNAARFYPLVRDYDCLYYLICVCSDDKDAVLKLIASRDWQSLLQLAPPNKKCEFLWVLGVRNVYERYFLCVVEEENISLHAEEIVFLQQFDRGEFEMIPFIESKRSYSIFKKLKGALYRFAQLISKIVN